MSNYCLPSLLVLMLGTEIMPFTDKTGGYAGLQNMKNGEVTRIIRDTGPFGCRRAVTSLKIVDVTYAQ